MDASVPRTGEVNTQADAPSGVGRSQVPNSRTLWAQLGHIFSRLLRGVILAGWIYVLAMVALLALTGRASDQLLGVGGAPTRRFFHVAAYTGTSGEKEVPCPSASGALSDWQDPDRSPVEAVLDDITPNWRVRQPGSAATCSRERAREITGYYYSAFDRLDSEIKPLIGDKEVDLRKLEIKSDILPENFGGNPTKPSIALPRKVTDWVVQKREEREKYRSRHALLDTFLLLTVIGAFGSLIFLIRDYVTTDNNSQIADYVFRPVLGVFLAMGMFVIDVLAESLLSSGGLESIRYEPLYALALAAGLLSEQTYQVLESRVKSSLEARKAERAGSAPEGATAASGNQPGH